MSRPPRPYPLPSRRLLATLLRALGRQRWWPARTPFEVCVGAVLTQNTAWSNVERAIANLRRARKLSPRGILDIPRPALARLLRPAGYFNVKEHRLRAFVRFFADEFGGSISRMRREGTVDLRARLLAVHGVGRETADSVLCYALGKPVFVVDAYTRRIFSRHGWIRGDEDYDAIRALVERAWVGLPATKRARDFNELHALLVAVGKGFCRPRSPRCETCPLCPLFPKSRPPSGGGAGKPLPRPLHARRA